MNTTDKNPTPIYTFDCEVKIVKHTFVERADMRTHENTAVYLIPNVEYTEVSRLFSAYLPEVSTFCRKCYKDDIKAYVLHCPNCGNEVQTENCELPAYVGRPVHEISRVALTRRNNLCNQHHLVVMSTGVIEVLRGRDGEKVQVDIFDPKYDSICDKAATVNRSAAIE